jgi:hypothetical protein
MASLSFCVAPLQLNGGAEFDCDVFINGWQWAGKD